MKFALVICTYNRPDPIIRLLESVKTQSTYPDVIFVVDGSSDEKTKFALENKRYKELKYSRIEKGQEGLTKQRNLGIALSLEIKEVEVVCFLDDDTVLTPTYFENLISTYSNHPFAIGVGGYILDEVEWNYNQQVRSNDEYELDGWVRKLGSRNYLRKKLGLLSDKPPGLMPDFSNGLSISFLPPSGKTYPVDFFMGGVSSWKAHIFKKIGFSEYFEGYGLYEDLDFCLRATKLGKMYVNTSASLYHLHDESGRPNKFNYGKMVMRNGWYVWRKTHPSPELKARLKWHSIAFLLTLVRIGNGFLTSKKKEAFLESAGRMAGWFSLFFNPPKLNCKL